MTVRTAIDSNVIVAHWSREPTASRMAALLRDARTAGPLVVSAPVWAELHAAPGATAAFVTHFLEDTGIKRDLDLGEAIWVRAAAAYASYAARRRSSAGGEPKRMLVDFLVGAHASERADRLLTLDARRYRHSFPDLRIEPSYGDAARIAIL